MGMGYGRGVLETAINMRGTTSRIRRYLCGRTEKCQRKLLERSKARVRRNVQERRFIFQGGVGVQTPTWIEYA